ncbi:MAG: hypothetical protein ACK5LZ_05865 [Anaerorhabdus sp.]
MKKKVVVLLSLVLVVLLVIVATIAMKPAKQTGAKVVFITVIVEGEVLYDEKITSSEEILGELLDDTDELNMKVEESSFGRFIVELYNVEQGDAATGPWWMYESENNEVCLQLGYCPGIDEVTIQDGDQFTFELSSAY